MTRTPKQWAAAVAAVALLALPGPLLVALFPEVFHLHTWSLLAALALTFPVTVPILRMAYRYFHEGAERG